ncbi:unnamed protein product [Camellia sinensis]
MALRPIDNALPITPERPKKQTKVALPIQKQSDVTVNDENKAPFPPTTIDATIDYISSENLKPLPDPEIKIQSLVEGLESKDWLKVCDSLNNARREKVMLVLVKAMKNPRSALCKTSIMASSDIFSAFGDQLLLEPTTSDPFDHLLLQLLLKASQDKRFVCEEADKALKAMVGSMTPLPLLQKLGASVSHSNLRIRAKAAISMSHCASKMGIGAIEEFGLVSLVQLAADLLNDRLPEAREAARSMVASIYEKFTENEEEKLESCCFVPVVLYRFKTRRTWTLGNIHLIGELLKQKIVPEKIGHHIVQELLGSDSKTCTEEENVEAICQFFYTIGKQLDESTKSRKINDTYFIQLEELSTNPQLAPRLTFMIHDVLDRCANNWVPRREKSKAKTITEIHLEADENLELRPGATASMRNNYVFLVDR